MQCKLSHLIDPFIHCVQYTKHTESFSNRKKKCNCSLRNAMRKQKKNKILHFIYSIATRYALCNGTSTKQQKIIEIFSSFFFYCALLVRWCVWECKLTWECINTEATTITTTITTTKSVFIPKGQRATRRIHIFFCAYFVIAHSSPEFLSIYQLMRCRQRATDIE